jgi:hypothetical protein
MNGDVIGYARTAESGRVVTRFFPCPTCGAARYSLYDGTLGLMPEILPMRLQQDSNPQVLAR